METKDYSLFTLASANRCINQAHVKRLKKSIGRTGGNIQPIIVDHNNVVIDGQHRLEACKQLNIPVSFHRTDKDISLYTAVIEANVTQKSWKIQDYILHYKNLNIHGYAALDNLIDSSKVSPTAVFLLTGQNRRSIKLGNAIEISNEDSNLVRVFIILRAAYRKKTGMKLRENLFAQALKRIQTSINQRINRGEDLSVDLFSITERFEKVVPIDGIADDTDTIYKFISKAIDYMQRDKLYI